MPSYDPQRSRPRAVPDVEDPAPVDALLDATHNQAPSHEEPAPAPAPVHAPATAPEHVHGPGCEHRAPGGVAARVAALASAAVAVVLVRRWRRRRRA